jgi:hypothetical protein
MSLTKKVAELIRVSMISSLTEKRSDGKITPENFKSLVEGIENSSDKLILESTILSEKKGSKKFWIKKAVAKKGGLHRALGVPENKKIPAKKLTVKAADSTKVKKQKVLAKTLKKIAKK